MAKIDTINKYINEYLNGKSEEAVARFRQKDEARQYQSIMTWRYNLRKKNKAKPQPESNPTPQTLLRNVRSAIEKSDLTISNIDEITLELNSLLGYVADYRRKLTLQEIDRLEQQKTEIAERLTALRSEMGHDDQPTLFD